MTKEQRIQTAADEIEKLSPYAEGYRQQVVLILDALADDEPMERPKETSEVPTRRVLTVERLVKILENAWADLRRYCPDAWDSMDELENEIAKLTHETSVDVNKRLMGKSHHLARGCIGRAKRDGVARLKEAALQTIEAFRRHSIADPHDGSAYGDAEGALKDALAALESKEEG